MRRLDVLGSLVTAMLAVTIPACALEPEEQAEDEEQEMSHLEKLAIIDSAKEVTINHAVCNSAPAEEGFENRFVADAAFTGAANQRSGSSTSCVILGVLQPTDDARYFCFTVGLDGFTYTYLENLRTGVRGWTRDNLLRFNGSNSQCFF